MNEYTDITTIRTEDTIASEIRTIVSQTQKTMLDAAVEIGRRLKEAKELVNHGEWGTWLKEKVDFSKSTANNFMRLFDEYGDKQITLFGAVANSQTFGNLSYSKALALLALPEEEREEFVENHPVDDMSTRELEKKIKELQEENDKAKAELKEAISSLEEVENIYEERLIKLENQHKDLMNSYAEADKKAKSLQEELEALDKSESGIDEEEVNKRIEEERKKIEAKLKEVEAAREAAESASAKAKRELMDLKEEQEDAIEAAKAKAAEETAEKVRQEEANLIEQLKRDAEEANAKLREAERKAGLAGDANVLRFKFLADQLQKDFHQTMGVISEFEEKEQRQKLKAALKTVLESLIENLEARDE